MALLDSVSGKTEKARMYFIKNGYGVGTVSKPKVTVQANGSYTVNNMFSPDYMVSASGGVFDGQSLENYKASYNQYLQNQDGANNGNAAGNQGLAAGNNLFDILNDANQNENRMEVCLQFNPSSIRINASGGGLVPVYNSVAPAQEGDGNQNKDAGAISVKYQRGKEHINIDISTVFDALNITDAFMNENLNIENLMKGWGKTAANKFAKKYWGEDSTQYSIRPVMEGFLAAFAETYRQTVKFVWGNMAYTGILTSIDCNYTMFNTVGEPVRATVTFGILSSEADKDHFWEQRYRQIVESVDNDGNVPTSTNHSSRVANNLINLQL